MKKLIPVDLKRCQAEWKRGSFMSFGMPPIERCEKEPFAIISENRKRGKMSVCKECFAVAYKQFSGKLSVKYI